MSPQIFLAVFMPTCIISSKVRGQPITVVPPLTRGLVLRAVADLRRHDRRAPWPIARSSRLIRHCYKKGCLPAASSDSTDLWRRLYEIESCLSTPFSATPDDLSVDCAPAIWADPPEPQVIAESALGLFQDRRLPLPPSVRSVQREKLFLEPRQASVDRRDLTLDPRVVPIGDDHDRQGGENRPHRTSTPTA